MSHADFATERPGLRPMIYAFSLPGLSSHEGFLKVGYTTREVKTRVDEQLRFLGAEGKPRLHLRESAMRKDGTHFTDKDVHRILERMGKCRMGNSEWFRCEVAELRAAIRELKTGRVADARRLGCFAMRPEQRAAVERTCAYFERAAAESPGKPPRFLWNAKMRFGKTFAAYQLARSMGLRRVLVLTFKPAVESAWREDLESHVDFEGWQFVSNTDAAGRKLNVDELFAAADKARPVVVFGSFQDLLGTNEAGGIKAKNEFIHATHWDLVIFDEYHYGAWRENAKKLFEQPDEEVPFDAERYQLSEAGNACDEFSLPLTASYKLFLSGTPFRALHSGEFIEEQIYSWTYSDEQRAKESWVGEDNPYAALPQMVMMTYRIPDSIRQIAMQGEFNEFDLNEFFSAAGSGTAARFVHENEVQKWLDLIRGAHLPSNVDELRLAQGKRPPMPYSDTRLLSVLSHTLWFLPNVASCEAMANLLQQRQNKWFTERYKVCVCAGKHVGVGLKALKPVLQNMGNPLETGSITLSCGKLTTGVTVRPWSGVFMLANLSSPESYFQTAFRAQSPWTVQDDEGHTVIMKEKCYVFDFALDRALRQIADYSGRLNIAEGDPEQRVRDFISFLPVYACEGGVMREINAQDVLDIATSGTSATLLAKRWESVLLVNVDNETLRRLMDNPGTMDALMSIEGFHSLNADIETIINRSELVRRSRREGGRPTPEQRQELSAAEREYKTLRRRIQERLIKFATRIPVFMYLTDKRERSLRDVITQLEPGLFRKVTGLDVADFEQLCKLNIFNASLMNDAIFKFRRYEDASLSYTGIDRHAGKDIGGWDTVISEAEYEQLFAGQQASLSNAPSTHKG